MELIHDQMQTLLRPGDTIIVGEGAGEPTTLLRLASNLGVMPLTAFLGVGAAPPLTIAERGYLKLRSYGAIGTTRQYARKATRYCSS